MSKAENMWESGHHAIETLTQPIASCGYDEQEMLILELLRYFCLSYAAPQSLGWSNAFKKSRETYGVQDGPALAYAVSEFLNAIRAERSNVFNFVDPRCSRCSTRIFPTEMHIMKLLQGVVGGDDDKLSAAARDITNTLEAPRTVQAGYELVSCLESIKLNNQLKSNNFGATSKRLH